MIENAPADAPMDNKTKILIALPLVLIITLSVAAVYIPFQIDLSGSEREILNFNPENLEFRKKKDIVISSNLHSPIDFSARIADNSSGLEGDLVHKLDYNDKGLSLIVISGEKKMAVINGSLRKEGDFVDGMKVARIEPGKVLLKDKGSQWLYLKETK